jgi:hypothetical protein
MISQEKRDFLKHVATGIRIVMDARGIDDKLVKNSTSEVGACVRDNFMVSEDGRPRFSAEKFRAVLDTIDEKKLCDILLYLDSVDVTVHHAWLETRLYSDDLEEGHGKFYAREVEDECIMRFEHFIDIDF